jgi:hypothetical protein
MEQRSIQQVLSISYLSMTDFDPRQWRAAAAPQAFDSGPATVELGNRKHKKARDIVGWLLGID